MINKTIPPINLATMHRQSSSQQSGLHIINQTLPSRGFSLFNHSQQQQQPTSGIWTNTAPNASLITINNQPQLCCPPGSNQTKPPATLRSRPMSAGGYTNNIGGFSNPVALNGSNKRVFKDSNIKTNSWVKGTSNSYIQHPVVDSETYRQVTNKLADSLEFIGLNHLKF